MGKSFLEMIGEEYGRINEGREREGCTEIEK
jgi:hypothetical protein